MFEKERPESRIIDELCFPDITDKLIDRLGLSWNDFYALVYEEGRLPHEAALRLLAAVESHHALAEKLLTLLHYYLRLVRESRTCCYAMQGITQGRAPWHGGPKSAISPTRVPG